MRNPVMRALREAVRAEISNAFEMIGHARPREVARVVCALHPSDVQSIGARLAEDALTEIARRELKKNTQGRDLVSQMQLPGVPETLTAQLPPAISIPLDADRKKTAKASSTSRWPRPRWPTSMPTCSC